jgi:hypothetical protein
MEWGSEVFSDFADSYGNTLNSTYIFELGAFTPGFVPDQSNVSLWLENWLVFDRASYSESNGYFSSTVQMGDDGRSDSPDQTPGTISFAGLDAYIWVRNEDEPVPGTEWLLTRTAYWTFPVAESGCCGNEVPIQWSLSDLDSGDVPLWGSQGGVDGWGVQTDTDIHTLQTFTFLPEVSSAVLVCMAGVFSLLRRHRTTN